MLAKAYDERGSDRNSQCLSTKEDLYGCGSVEENEKDRSSIGDGWYVADDNDNSISCK